MANVQPENGTVNIAYDLFEAIIKMKISRTHKDHVLAVLRKTYGYRDQKTKKPKKEDAISYSQFAELCRCSLRESMRTIRDLVNWHILSYDKSDICVNGHMINKYSVVKDYDTWDKKVWGKKTYDKPDICVNGHMTKTEKHMSNQSYTETNNTETNNTETNNTLMDISAKAENPPKKKRISKEDKNKILTEKMKIDVDFMNFKTIYPAGWTDQQGQFNPYYCKDEELYAYWLKLKNGDKEKIKEHEPIYLERCKKIMSPINYLKRTLWILIPLPTLLKLPQRQAFSSSAHTIHEPGKYDHVKADNAKE